MLLLLLMCILLSNCGQILVWEICRVSRCYLLILCHHGRLLETEQARLAWSPLLGLRDGRASALQEAIERVNIFYILYLVKRWRGRTMIWNEHGVKFCSSHSCIKHLHFWTQAKSMASSVELWFLLLLLMIHFCPFCLVRISWLQIFAVSKFADWFLFQSIFSL